jgi:hypothetical protein
LLPPLLERLRESVVAGTICVNFAISFASWVVVLHQPYEPYDAARRLGLH